jgi:hypothetical protein
MRVPEGWEATAVAVSMFLVAMSLIAFVKLIGG